MKNIAVIGACALSQYLTMRLSQRYTQSFIYAFPGNGATDLYPRVNNLSQEFTLSLESIKKLKAYEITHVLVLDEQSLQKGAIEYLQSHGFITQVASTKNQYLTQKISQSRLWARRYGLDSWPNEVCHDTSKAHHYLQRIENPSICTEGGLNSCSIEIKDLKDVQLRSLAFQTLVLEQKLDKKNLITQLYDTDEKKCIKEFLHLDHDQYIAQKPQHDLQELTSRLLGGLEQEGFLSGRFFVLSWTQQEHQQLSEKYKFCELSALLHSKFFPVLESIDWKKSDLFDEKFHFNKKKKFAMKQLVNYQQKKNNYQIMQDWELKTMSIFHNHSARYENGQILARKPHFGYDLS